MKLSGWGGVGRCTRERQAAGAATRDRNRGCRKQAGAATGNLPARLARPALSWTANGLQEGIEQAA